MEKKLLLPLAVAHKHAHGGGGERPWARPWRWAKTAFFVAAMLASLLLVCAPPLLVVLLDLALPPVLLSATLRGSLAPAVVAQARAFDFRSSLVDLPSLPGHKKLVSIVCSPQPRARDRSNQTRKSRVATPHPAPARPTPPSTRRSKRR